MASRLCQRLEILFPQAARHIQQSSCVPDFQHQALASQDGLSMVSQDEAFTHLLLLITERKELQEKCYEKILPGLMRHFPPFAAQVQGKGFCRSITAFVVSRNTYFHTILYLAVFCQ